MGNVGPWILGELRNYLLCFQFQCKCFQCELMEKSRDNRREGESGLQDVLRHTLSILPMICCL